MLLFSVGESSELQLAGAGAGDDCGAINEELNQQLYNYSRDKIRPGQTDCTVEYEY